jgi:hypothetical protein
MATRYRLVSCSRRPTTVITERVDRQVLATILGKGRASLIRRWPRVAIKSVVAESARRDRAVKGHQPRLMPDCFAGRPFHLREQNGMIGH